MNQRSIQYLIFFVGILLLLVFVVAVTGGGIDDRIQAMAQAELRHYNDARKQLDNYSDQVEKALDEEPELLASRGGKQWPATFKNLDNQLDALQSQCQEIRKLLDENEPKTETALQNRVQNVNDARNQILARAADIANTAESLIEFKNNIQKNLEKVQADYQAVTSVSLAPLKTQAQQAALDFPNKKEDLDSRITALTDMVEQARTAWAESAAQREAAAEKDYENLDVNKLVNLSQQMQQYRNTLEGAESQLPALIDQLYWSWDKILADMDIRSRSSYYQKHQTVKTRALDKDAPETAEPEVKKEEKWVQVTSAKFKSMEKNLGMTIEHKPAGKYDYEAEEFVQPPGYAYIAPQGQSNRYGYWHTSGGTSFWVFYGQYSLMRDLFWGRNYNPIPYDNYRNYRLSRQSGTTYYGTDATGKPRYGSNGTYTKTRYAGSKYVSTGGFKSSRYTSGRSGYSGSRYSGSRSSRSYRSSSRSSGSRFGGGK